MDSNHLEHIASDEHGQRASLAQIIERRARDIVDRWLDRVRSDASPARVPLTDLREGITEYLRHMAELLRGGSTLDGAGVSAWTGVARGYAITRVRLGFDVSQLFHELVSLRRVIGEVLRQEGVPAGGHQAERVADLVDAAISESIKSYIDFRDYAARRSEAEHIAFLSHELRNPLSAAALAASQLRRPVSFESQQRLLDILNRSVDRLRRMIDDVLMTERLQAGEVEARPVDMTFEELIGDVLEVSERLAANKGLAFRASFDPELTVRADPNLTLSALENLLDNAIKFTDAGEVTLEVEEHAGEVVIHVRDHCGGIAPEELRVIFEPFRRAHSRKPGTGLGLSIARRAVEAQGGTIQAESSAEMGCHFWFTLPRTQH